ncbi:DUF86 domain-containing protein [Halochromatium salexigens]|uniref:DUF86 domain-containing protein n=1 Tax=Halochromatium salexigens TaxID=49447 RepID=A0AAJ0XG54_HALSE|nr:DUF86 domain-containing protein [Halochromatium salexigens]MBK5930390.1 hypothetical protein [Halochromatium salexigens]
MNSKTLRVPDYLGHILQAIDRIQAYTDQASKQAFVDNAQLQDAVIRNLEIIGEASRNVQLHGPDLIAQHQDIPWSALYAMRNRISHGYWSVDLEIVWTVVQRDLPDLRVQLQSLVSQLKA